MPDTGLLVSVNIWAAAMTIDVLIISYTTWTIDDVSAFAKFTQLHV
jgi:hypothetical protein